MLFCIPEMKPGYGMFQIAQGIRVAACLVNSYGSPNVTFGRGRSLNPRALPPISTLRPCRPCPTNMVTPANITAASAVIKNADDTGYTSPLACMTQPGFGMYDSARFWL